MLIRYSLHGHDFDVIAADDIADDIAAAVMPGCVGRAARRRAAETFEVRREGRKYTVARGGRTLWRMERKYALIPWFESEVMTWLLARLSDYMPVHAAAVHDDAGRAVLIAGPPEAGKTSLAYAAGVAGWRIMTDEAALIDRRGLAVYSFPRAMLIKPQTARAWPELRKVAGRQVQLDSGLTRVRYVNPASVGGASAPSAPVANIVFPVWARRTAIERIGEREALDRLLRVAFYTGGRERTVDMCVRLVRSCPAWRLWSADAREAAALLGSLDD